MAKSTKLKLEEAQKSFVAGRTFLYSDGQKYCSDGNFIYTDSVNTVYAKVEALEDTGVTIMRKVFEVEVKLFIEYRRMAF